MRGLDGLIAPGEALTEIRGGFRFTEGPVWLAAEQCLLFSDIPDDSRWRWSAARGIELVARPTFKGNGMCLDNDGNLLVCEHVSSCVARIREGRRETVAFHYGGRYLNSPNDLVTRALDGSIYFTDPAVGRLNAEFGSLRSRDLDFQGVYRVDASGGEVELVVAERAFERPNGLCFSPDQSLLYVNDSAFGAITAFVVAADGSLGDPRVLAQGIGSGVMGAGNVDGMECDERGNIWVAGPGGVWVLTPDGEPLGTIAVPEVVGSLSWGGEDLRTLFVTSSTTLRAIRTIVGPAPLPPLPR